MMPRHSGACAIAVSDVNSDPRGWMRSANPSTCTLTGSWNASPGSFPTAIENDRSPQRGELHINCGNFREQCRAVGILRRPRINDGELGAAAVDAKRRMGQSSADSYGRLQAKQPQALGMAADVQIERFGVEVNLPRARDQDRVRVSDQGLGAERAVMRFEARHRAAHDAVLLVLGQQQPQAAQVDAAEL